METRKWAPPTLSYPIGIPILIRNFFMSIHMGYWMASQVLM